MSIFIYHHKNSIATSLPNCNHLQVGASLATALIPDILYDSENISISKKNKSYCELTGQYWVWKNLELQKDDLIGFCHYRRYFNFSPSEFNKPKWFKKKLKAEQLQLNYKEYLKYHENLIHFFDTARFESIDVITPPKWPLTMSMKDHYIYHHLKEDWDTMEDYLRKRYDQKKLHKVFNQKWLYSYNMFVLKEKIFTHYSNWLFDILFAIEDKIFLHTHPYQKRVFGFLSERLFNIYYSLYLENQYKTLELPVIYINDL